MKFSIFELFVIFAVIGLIASILFSPNREHGCKSVRYRVRKPNTFRFMSSAFVLLLLLAMTFPAAAQSQVQVYQVTTLTAPTNLPPIITAGATSNQTYILNVPQKVNLAAAWKFNVSSGTSVASLQIAPSVDGTNYDTVPWQLNRAANGATDVIVTTNWSYLQLAAYRTLKITAMTNGNAGTLTNKGVTFGQVNP